MARLLADAASALLPVASAPRPLSTAQLSACCACAVLMGNLLSLCHGPAGLRLADGDALRLLAAGALPLQARLVSDGDEDAVICLLDACSGAVGCLANAAKGQIAGLPPRALAAAARTTLRPQAFADWLARALDSFGEWHAAAGCPANALPCKPCVSVSSPCSARLSPGCLPPASPCTQARGRRRMWSHPASWAQP